MQQREYPPRLDEIDPDVPPALGERGRSARWRSSPRERYASAEEMREALHDGARGIAPPGGEPTAATSMLARAEPTAATRAVPSARRLEPQAPRSARHRSTSPSRWIASAAATSRASGAPAAWSRSC